MAAYPWVCRHFTKPRAKSRQVNYWLQTQSLIWILNPTALQGCWLGSQPFTHWRWAMSLLRVSSALLLAAGNEHQSMRLAEQSLTAHCPLLAKYVQPQTGEACGLQKQTSHTSQPHWFQQRCSKGTLLQLRWPWGPVYLMCSSSVSIILVILIFIGVEMFNLLKRIEIIFRWGK